MALDFARSYISKLDSIDWDHVNQIYEEMETEALSSLIESGASRDDIAFERSADMRYAGQFYEIPSPIPSGKLWADRVSEITQSFYHTYEKTFSRYLTDAPIQALTWRLRAQCPTPALKIKYTGTQELEGLNESKGRRNAYFPEQKRFIECPVYERYRLKPRIKLSGPTIIEERESTTIVGVDSEVWVDGYIASDR